MLCTVPGTWEYLINGTYYPYSFINKTLIIHFVPNTLLGIESLVWTKQTHPLLLWTFCLSKLMEGWGMDIMILFFSLVLLITSCFVFPFCIRVVTILMHTHCIKIHIGFVWVGKYVLWVYRVVNEIWVPDSLDTILKGKDMPHVPLILCCVC